MGLAQLAVPVGPAFAVACRPSGTPSVVIVHFQWFNTQLQQLREEPWPGHPAYGHSGDGGPAVVRNGMPDADWRWASAARTAGEWAGVCTCPRTRSRHRVEAWFKPDAKLCESQNFATI